MAGNYDIIRTMKAWKQIFDVNGTTNVFNGVDR